MKRFKLKSTILIVGLVTLLIYNISCLVKLYNEVSAQTKEMVIQALKDADLDEILNRSERYPPLDSMANIEQVFSQSRHIKDDTLMVSILDQEGQLVELRKEPLKPGTNYSDIMVSEIANGAHQSIDPLINLRIADLDSLFRLAITRTGIHPEVATILNIDRKGNVLNGDVRIKQNPRLDSVSICYNIISGERYVAYYSRPTEYVFRQMQGIVLSTAAIIILISISFTYLFQTVSKLRTLEEMKDDFVNNMTHELKTPISIAYSANDALLHYDSINDTIKKTAYLTIAMSQLKHLSELVEKILAMSMERRRTMTLKLEKIDLSQLIVDLEESQRMRRDKVINIEVHAEENVIVTADKSHLSNVLNNLIDNAIKYSGESVIIRIHLTAEGIKIADNGIGIPAKSLSYIFDKFYRVPHGNRQDSRGYGIGLYYVKLVIEKMGWEISVKSQEGRGTIFTIKFVS